MVLLKTTVVVLLAVACVSAADLTVVKSPKEHAEQKIDPSVHLEPAQPLPSGSNTIHLITPITNNTTTEKPSTTPLPYTTTKNPASTTTPSSVTTTTPPSNVTTTTSPSNVTTTTSPSNVTTTTPPSNVTTTTQRPDVTTTTLSPNVTTTAIPPTPEPSPARSWDGPSFLGGMVLAFGIVAVGFVGYRFFYLGRGGAYHTL